MEKREEVKREVKRRVEEEEREKERKKRDEEIRKETQELLAIRDVTSYGNNNAPNPSSQPHDLPKLGRRVNNFQYFRWYSDEEIPVIPLERAPSSLRFFLEKYCFNSILNKFQNFSLFSCSCSQLIWSLRALHIGSSLS